MKIKLVGKPKDAPYLTPGKVYEVVNTLNPAGTRVTIIDDESEEIGVGPFEHCPHARPALWRVVE